jgi:hypothetical protein
MFFQTDPLPKKRVTLPEALRKSGRIGRIVEGAVLAPFASGERLEVWPVEDWNRHVREKSGRVRPLIQEAEAELDDLRE